MPARVQLMIGEAPDDVWTGVALPWFRAAAAEAWKSAAPFVALTPSRQHGFFLKSLLAAENIPVAGIHFWTPGECRDALTARLRHKPVAGVREHLHLLLAAAAEPESSSLARSVARDPSGLMRALDALDAAGLAWDALPYPALQPVVARFRAFLDRTGWTTVQHIDRLLARTLAGRAEHHGPAIQGLLVAGFDGAHWPLWNLLQAAVAASAAATVGLLLPKFKTEQLDQAWVGSWEQLHGEAEAAAAASESGPFAPLAERMENPQGAARPEQRAAVRLGYDLQEQARAAAAQAVAFLASDTCERLGLVVPGYGALSREIAAELKRLGIAFNDTIGCHAPGATDDAAWRAWIALQAAPELETLAAFLRHRPDVSPAPCEDALDALTRAADETLSHDLAVLAAYLGDATHDRDRAVGAWLAGLALLPDRAPLEAFVAATRGALSALGWPDRAEAAARAATPMLAALREPIGRATYTDWLAHATTGSFRVRDTAATHPFARVQLLTYAQAEGQRWTHLVLTGLNEGVWPPRLEPLPFLPDREVEAINRGATSEGRQGDGHLTVTPGRAILLGPAQRRALLQRQFYSLVEAPACGLCLTASLTDEADPSRHLLPSEYLTYLYFIQHGAPLSDEAAGRLREETAAWIAQLAPETSRAEVAATREAYTARRQPDAPFGRYAFAFDRAPSFTPSVSCERWERAVRYPASTWLEVYCGVACADLDLTDDGRVRTLGSWVHRWLGHAIADRGGTLVPWPLPGPLRDRLDAAAQESRQRIARAHAAAKRGLPDRWTAAWEEARWTARRLAASLEAVTGWARAASELRLPAGLAADTGAGRIRLIGRIDLLLVQEPATCWIIDFKTGNVKPLTPKNLAGNLQKGQGIQIGLYVLAQRAQGMAPVHATLLVPGAAAVPQVSHEEISACDEVWREIARMQETGIFGMREVVRPEFGHGVAFPLATLTVDKEILDAKWALTHPVFTKETEE